MECEHLSDHQKGSAEILLSETPQKELPVTKTACVFLSLHNRECVDILRVCGMPAAQRQRGKHFYFILFYVNREVSV